MTSYQLKRIAVRLYRLIFDSSVVIGLICGFFLGAYVVSSAVLEAFQELDKSKLDVCVKRSSVNQ